MAGDKILDNIEYVECIHSGVSEIIEYLKEEHELLVQDSCISNIVKDIFVKAYRYGYSDCLGKIMKKDDNKD